jgi:hypothetical protein
MHAAQALDSAQAAFHQKGQERRRWAALARGHSLVGLAEHARGELGAATSCSDAAQARQALPAAVPCPLSA